MLSALIFALTVLFFCISFVLLVGFAFSKDEFFKRNNWKEIDPKTATIDWRRVDAGRLMFYILVKSWQTTAIILILYFLGRFLSV